MFDALISAFTGDVADVAPLLAELDMLQAPPVSTRLIIDEIFPVGTARSRRLAKQARSASAPYQIPHQIEGSRPLPAIEAPAVTPSAVRFNTPAFDIEDDDEEPLPLSMFDDPYRTRKKIPRPQGYAGRPGSGGFTLETILEPYYTPAQYKQLRVRNLPPTSYDQTCAESPYRSS
jgi:hypothetical protein